MAAPANLNRIVRDRVVATAADRLATRKAIASGRPLSAEKDPGRAAAYSRRLVSRISQNAAVATIPPLGAERVQGVTVDWVDACFLTSGAQAARAVGCVYSDSGRTAVGTGFLFAPGLFLTNQHVLLEEATARGGEIEFDYEVSSGGVGIVPTRFRLAPQDFFLTIPYDDLDVAVVAVGGVIRGPGRLDEYGYCPLRDGDNKHSVGMPVNIIQHPNGRPKQVVIRRNDLVARIGKVLHYESDTAEGSSGSPVFNDFWEVIALHHWGEPFLETRNEEGIQVPITVNEGIRTSMIVERLRQIAQTLPADRKLRLLNALSVTTPPTTANRPIDLGTRPGPEKGAVAMPERTDPIIEAGIARIVVPLEISFRVLPTMPIVQVAGAPLLDREGRAVVDTDRIPGPEKAFIDRDYENRDGYASDFLATAVPLPTLSVAQKDDIAPLADGQADAAGGLLAYENFSLVLSKSRKFAFFTATNIDGSHYISVDRTTGLPVDVGPEGDTWYDDDRMDKANTVRKSWYGNHSNYYDRGHLTRRNDPTWGTQDEAVRANGDTFHWTNCSPQHWRFNQSTRYWQGVERYYLEYGIRLDRKRITVFTGPVLEANDPALDGVRVPQQFWKIVARVTDAGLAATGFLVSQKELVDADEERKFLGKPKEDAPPPQIDQYLASIQSIEDLTGLKFGPLKAADTFQPAGPEGGEASRRQRITGWGDLLK